MFASIPGLYWVNPFLIMPRSFFASGPPIDSATNLWARNILKKELKNFGNTNCAHVLRKVLGDSTYQTNDLRTLAANTNFYDASNPRYGSLTGATLAGEPGENGSYQISHWFGGGVGGRTFIDSPFANAPIALDRALISSRKSTYAIFDLLHELPTATFVDLKAKRTEPATI